MTFGERIKLILMFKKISQKDFSKQIGIYQSQLSLLLNNKRMPTSRELIKIVSVLNVPYECLIGNVSLFDDLLIDCASIYHLW